FSGKTGVGKSHLSMGILQEVLEKSNYDKKCLFINYRELLEQLKFAMNDEQVRKQITGVVMKDIKLADVVVIDDLGAELGSVENPTRATNFDLDTITSIMEARQDKATVITTNLTGKMISELYSDRIVSRIMDNSHGYTMSFKTSKDKRMQPTF
ncbi:MAG: ATP-binding protein, partial [Pisciglobus halotolerans]|nr:ATP-binding protein [Pisciglobus halotolerans]